MIDDVIELLRQLSCAHKNLGRKHGTLNNKKKNRTKTLPPLTLPKLLQIASVTITSLVPQKCFSTR